MTAPGYGKSKGSGFERVVCHELSLWISNGKHDDLFWRSSNSGGRSTVIFKKGGENRTQQGDITAIHSDGNPLTDKCLISCKFYKNLQIEGAVIGNKGGLTAFWAECVEEAARYGKLPVLISKQNRTNPFICLNDAGMDYFKLRYKGKELAQLPISGGVQILWLATFIKHAQRPGITTRPRIMVRP